MFRPGRILALGWQLQRRALVIDVTGAGTPALDAHPALSSQRQWVTATVLAGRKVLATGGSQLDNELSGSTTRQRSGTRTTGQWMQGPVGSTRASTTPTPSFFPMRACWYSGGGALNPADTS
jgi:hypothetical protein